jgi:MFS family permease
MTPPRDQAQPLTTRDAFRRVFPGVMVAMFLAAADQTILATALPAIAAALGGLAELSWVVTAYLLAAAIAAPIYGRVGDYFGRRRMLLVALGIFAAASAFCAVATSLPMLIVGRHCRGSAAAG